MPVGIYTDIKPDFSVSFVPTNTPLAMRNSKKKPQTYPGRGLVYFQFLILAVFAMRQVLVNAHDIQWSGKSEEFALPIESRKAGVLGNANGALDVPSPQNSEKHFISSRKKWKITHCCENRAFSSRELLKFSGHSLAVLQIVSIRFLMTQIVFEVHLPTGKLKE